MPRLALATALLAGTAATAAPAFAMDAAAEEEIIVTARAQRLYRVEQAQLGKLPTEPLRSPLSLTVLNDQLIRDQGARDAQDLYRNIAGVSVFSYAGVTARGFRQEEIFYDGIRGDPYAGFSVPQLFNIAQVEFLKGPSGMLYGPGAPGGLFNYVTKKPGDGRTAQVRAVVGSQDRYGGSVEVDQPLGERGLAARGGLFYEDRDLPRANAGSQVLIADGGISFGEGPGRLILQATRYVQNLDGNRLRGVPTDNAGRFLASRRWNHNEPGDFLDLDSQVVQGRAELKPSDALRLDATLRWNAARETQQYHEPRGLFDSDRDGVVDASTREYRDQIRTQESLSLGANLVWQPQLPTRAGLRVLGGMDWSAGELDFRGRLVRGRTTAAPGLPPPLSLRDPVYGLADPASYRLPAFTRSLTQEERLGAYALGEVTVGQLILSGGGRWDRFTDRFGNEQFRASRPSWRAGAVYRITPEVSLFGQWATSFQPQDIDAQDPRAGGPFAPTLGKVIEGGVKTALRGGRIQSSLSAYRIVRTNVLQSDPRGDPGNDGIDDLVAFGEVTSKGAELEAAADLTPDWVLTLAYAWNDTRIARDNGTGGFSNNVGDRFANAPRHALGFWTRYQLPRPGIAFALGGDYVSERISLSNQRVRPYFITDASIILTRGRWTALVRIDNLFDKTYAASGFIDRTGHFPGEPRSLFFEIGRTF